MSAHCHIARELLPLFHDGRAAPLDMLMDADLGQPVSRGKGGRQVIRLTLSGSIYYLKRCGREPLLRHLSMILRGHRPASSPLREKRMADLLHAAGFAVMKPVAWGERGHLGIPSSGFLVVAGIPGTEIALEFDRSRGTARLRLMRDLGILTGRLHARGFLHAVRFKDLIHSPEGLALIDRETSKPWPKRWFTRNSCTKSLARSARRILRDGHRPGPGSTAAFFRGYAQGLSSRWNIPARTLAAMTMRNLRSELAAHPGR